MRFDKKNADAWHVKRKQGVLAKTNQHSLAGWRVAGEIQVFLDCAVIFDQSVMKSKLDFQRSRWSGCRHFKTQQHWFHIDLILSSGLYVAVYETAKVSTRVEMWSYAWHKDLCCFEYFYYVSPASWRKQPNFSWRYTKEASITGSIAISREPSEIYRHWKILDIFWSTEEPLFNERTE